MVHYKTSPFPNRKTAQANHIIKRKHYSGDWFNSRAMIAVQTCPPEHHSLQVYEGLILVTWEHHDNGLALFSLDSATQMSSE